MGDSVLLGKDLVKICAKLYHYDFTRFDTEWNRGIPGALVMDNATDWIPTQYWNRRFVRMYLGKIDKDHQGLEQRLSSYGYATVCEEHVCHAFCCRLASRVGIFSLAHLRTEAIASLVAPLQRK